MNYIDCIKQNAILYVLIVLSYTIPYTIVCHFGWGKEIILTSEHTAAITGATITFIFFGPFISMWMNPSNK